MITAGDPARLTIFVPHASDLLTDAQSNGDGLVAFEVVSRLAERGHRVHAVAPAIDIRGSVPPQLLLHRIRTHRDERFAGAHRLRYAIAVRALFERIRRHERLDVVHQLNPVVSGLSLALAGSGLPVVLGSYIADWPAGIDAVRPGRRDRGFVRRAKRAIDALQQRRAAALLITTDAARGRIAVSERAANVALLPHGVDERLFSPETEPESTDRPRQLLFLGGIEDRKGIFDLLEAFRSIHRRVPDMRLAIYGSGHRSLRLAEIVGAMAERSHIDVMGGAPRADVPALMRAATIYCMPSRGEPFGISLLEAMASGKPVVVTDAGGPAHLVDEDGGRKVAPGDVGALADAVVEIASSPGLQARMGAYNRACVERLYSWDRVIDRLERVYAGVVRGER